MNFDYAKNKVGYSSIFCESPEEAANQLLRLIVNKECGYDEGASEWHTTLKEWLDGNYDLSELNHCGACFSREQWRDILGNVVVGLETHERQLLK